jgi:hypothetical protein
MSTISNILNVGQTMQAVGIATNAGRAAFKKRKRMQNMIGSATETIVGTSFLGAQANIIAGL